ncbi:alpha/beta hydrolase family protein [Flavobacterium ajazii]|uniref:alpha/beta hydrolase family protein n=1 Tax=Flavobacterium ajazii TaxID=2692318 RepID=UPI0013CF984E|nr:alpha/beta hydrolase [Flavobacterium ajazii]
MEKESFEVKCDDGTILKGLIVKPQNPKAVIQFNCGTGIRKEFYFPFVNFLVENNYLCCLWDYRGIGESKLMDLKLVNFSYSDYGLKDMTAIKKYLETRFIMLPFFIVGHSVGGQQIGFIQSLENIKGVVNFAVSSGYYSYMPLKYRIKAYFFFYLFSPISIFFTGYVKAKSFGFMEDLPKNVVYEWRNWLEKKDYFFDKKFNGKSVFTENFKRIKFPIHVFLTTDDEISTRKNVTNFWRNIISDEEIVYTIFNPNQIGVDQIGHFGFFKKNMKNSVWIEVLNRLNEMLLIDEK